MRNRLAAVVAALVVLTGGSPVLARGRFAQGAAVRIAWGRARCAV